METWKIPMPKECAKVVLGTLGKGKESEVSVENSCSREEGRSLLVPTENTKSGNLLSKIKHSLALQGCDVLDVSEFARERVHQAKRHRRKFNGIPIRNMINIKKISVING